MVLTSVSRRQIVVDSGVFGTAVGVHISLIPAGKNKPFTLTDEVSLGVC